ncbi:porin [Polluticoccus soli]|uniref:porin n=1 Tax=Polluticoccus soli TaxID=3034150 RepID=UPI0023E2ECC1|nr:porin [Flavipsychrobacter sp. JY13-12]
MKRSIVLLSLVMMGNVAMAQRFLTDMMDTTTQIGKGLYPLYGSHDRLKFGGYMQPQFQWAEDKGVKNYAGGDFAPNSNNRFMLRRGRIRVDYMHMNDKNEPMALFAFQFDGSEKGVAIRDFWGRIYDNKLNMFALTAGMFARPMGFEANYSSSERESPERGRMSQILMKTERDLGMMGTFEPRKGQNFRWLKVDLGVFNGQGLAGPAEYDSHKDVIGRVSLKPRKLNKAGWTLSASASGYMGGITSQSPWIYEAKENEGVVSMIGDSSQSNINYVAPRKYYGADAQLKIPNRKGYSEFRAEYIAGQQTATAATSETPGTYPVTATNALLPLYTRSFNGAYFYYLQHLGVDWAQLVLKYDWYDPNTKVQGNDINASRGFTAADVKYNTIGGGFVVYLNAHVKTFLYYDHVTNESTAIKGYTNDIKDNIITIRLQYRF